MRQWLKSVLATIQKLGKSRQTSRRQRQAQLQLEALEDRMTPSVTLEISYSLDKTNFFNGHPDRQAALTYAAGVIQARLNNAGNQLAAIQPSGTNTWSPTVSDPSTPNGQQVAAPDPFDPTKPLAGVSANTIIIYAGGAEEGAPVITTNPDGSKFLNNLQTGEGGPVFGAAATGDQAWFDTINGRGKAGTLGAPGQQTAFAPWGGFVQFNSDLELTQTNSDPNNMPWWFGIGPNPNQTAFPGQPDFVSVAEHEIGHLLGFGTSNAWKNLVQNGSFIGQASQKEFGGPVPVSPDQAHWAPGTRDPGMPGQPFTTMESVSLVGRREEFTNLDFAGLADIGWSVNPPITGAAFTGAATTVIDVGNVSTSLLLDGRQALSAFSTQQLTLAPGSHTLSQSAGASVTFQVAADGTVSYDKSLQGALAGAGTGTLVVLGETVTLDTRALPVSSLVLNTSSNLVVSNTAPFTFTALPGAYTLSGLGSTVQFNLTPNGTVGYDSSLQGILTGAGTKTLGVQGTVVRVASGADAVLLDGQQTLSASASAWLALTPGTHTLQDTTTGALVQFNVSASGLVTYDSIEQGILNGNGTSLLTVSMFRKQRVFGVG